MQMIQDGVYANAGEKPLRMTGNVESCKVWVWSSVPYQYLFSLLF